MNDFNPKTVTIGNQVWMAENLSIDDGKGGIYHHLGSNETYETYYTWEAAMRIANNIPGWHLSSALEWNKAARACGAIEFPLEGNPGHYDYEFAQKLNDKLDIKLAGVYDGRYYGVGSSAYFWTSTEGSFSNIYYRYFSTGTSVNSGSTNKNSGCFSVRLVKDSTDNPNHDNPTDSLEVRIAELEAENKKLKAELRKQKAWENYEAPDNGWV